METKRGYRQVRTARPDDIGKTIKRIFSYMFKNKWQVALVIFFILMSSVTGIISSYVFKPIINDYVVPFIGQKDPDLTSFAVMLSVMALIYLLGLLSTYGRSKMMSIISTGVLGQIRRDLFNHLQDLPISYYDTHTHGMIMNFFTTDTDTMRQMIADTFPQFISSIITVVGTFTMMMVLSPILTLITIGMLIIMLIITYVLGKQSRENFKIIQRAAGDLNGYGEEMISGQKVIKVFSYEQTIKEGFFEIAEEMRVAATKANSAANMLMPITANLSYVAFALSAGVGAYLTIQGRFDVGSLAAFLMYCRQFAGPISMLAQQFNYVMSALAGAERVFNLLDMPSEVDNGKVVLVNAVEDEDGNLTECDHRTGVWAWKDPENGNALTKVRGDVRFDHVEFSYVPGKVVLKDISLFAKPGQKIALVGSTGAGKTTITNLINRFYDVQKGTITYDGIDVKKIKKDDLRRSLGMVLQDTNLFAGTVMENIRYGRLDATDEEVIAAAKLANAHSFITRLPQGYNTVLTANGSNLSQGQRQLLNISRAAVASPPVLILDEATSSIDTRTEHLIEAGMDEIMRGRTVFIIAHRLSTVRNSNAIMVMEHGEIIERGDHEQLLELKGRYYQLYTGKAELD
ncbi:MAG: ABC transporter ATP-binding protein [Christensenellaceae bacterium]|nr:ABC transporter ATP-binding protein [Christensenellaceae bacterium]